MCDSFNFLYYRFTFVIDILKLLHNVFSTSDKVHLNRLFNISGFDSEIGTKDLYNPLQYLRRNLNEELGSNSFLRICQPDVESIRRQLKTIMFLFSFRFVINFSCIFRVCT